MVKDTIISPNATTVIVCSCVQTAYINSLITYSEVNTAIELAVEHLVLTQVCMKVGVCIWGQQRVEAIVKEMRQFHDQEVVNCLLHSRITLEIKPKTLGYLIFLKKKRNGAIKSCGYVDGRQQRIYKSNEETPSPTVSIEGVYIVSVMDAQETRDIAIRIFLLRFYIPRQAMVQVSSYREQWWKH